MNLASMVSAAVTRPKNAKNMWHSRPEHRERARNFVENIGLDLSVFENKSDARHPNTSSMVVVLSHETMAAAKFLADSQYKLPLHLMARALLLGWLKEQLPSIGLPVPNEIRVGGMVELEDTSPEAVSPTAKVPPPPPRRKKTSKKVRRVSPSDH